MELAFNMEYYRVAGHLFAVMCSDDALLASFGNYEPFREKNHEATIFTLRIQHNGLLTQEQRAEYFPIFIDNTEDDMPRIEVYQTPNADGWLMRIAQIAHFPICCELQTDKFFIKGTLHIEAAYHDLRFCVDNALMLMFAFRTVPLMTLEMHAAVVVMRETKGEELGYLFLGHSGTGKSTHAQQWLQAFPDAWLLNDDNPILRVMDNGEVWVYGSPWSGKTPCYTNAHVRVGGIIKLSQAPVNELQQLTLPQAYAYMLSSASGLKIDPLMSDQLYETIKYIITHVKCYLLNCLPNTDAAEVCFQGVRG